MKCGKRLSFKRKVKTIAKHFENMHGRTFNRRSYISHLMSDYDLDKLNRRDACVDTLYGIIKRSK